MTDGRGTAGAGETRRDFIKKTATVAAGLSGAGVLSPVARGQDRGAKVALVTDDADPLLKEPPVRWALDQLQNRLRSRDDALLLRASRRPRRRLDLSGPQRRPG